MTGALDGCVRQCWGCFWTIPTSCTRSDMYRSKEYIYQQNKKQWRNKVFWKLFWSFSQCCYLWHTIIIWQISTGLTMANTHFCNKHMYRLHFLTSLNKKDLYYIQTSGLQGLTERHAKTVVSVVAVLRKTETVAHELRNRSLSIWNMTLKYSNNKVNGWIKKLGQRVTWLTVLT